MRISQLNCPVDKRDAIECLTQAGHAKGLYTNKASAAAAPALVDSEHGRVAVVLACEDCRQPFHAKHWIVAREGTQLSKRQEKDHRAIASAAQKHVCEEVRSPEHIIVCACLPAISLSIHSQCSCSSLVACVCWTARQQRARQRHRDERWRRIGAGGARGTRDSQGARSNDDHQGSQGQDHVQNR